MKREWGGEHAEGPTLGLSDSDLLLYGDEGHKVSVRKEWRGASFGLLQRALEHPREEHLCEAATGDQIEGAVERDGGVVLV